VEVTCLRPAESNAGVGHRDRAAQKVTEGEGDRHTYMQMERHTIHPLYDDMLSLNAFSESIGGYIKRRVRHTAPTLKVWLARECL